MTTTALTPALDQRRALSTKHVLGVFLFAAATALAAQIRVPLPGTPVPMTLQTLAVTLCALTLGARMGTASMVIYVMVGLVGFPVFADARGGLDVVFGATGGYLLGFILAQPAMGRITRREDGSYAGAGRLALGLIAGYAIIFTLGLAGLMVAASVGLPRALEMGLTPFIPGMLIKGAMAMALGLAIVPWAARRGW